MKRLLVCATLLAFLPTAQAAEKADFSHDAEYRFRMQYDQNGDFTESGSENTMMHRFKLGTTFRSGEKFSARLGLLHNSTLGTNVPAENSLPGGSGTYQADNEILVNEAYGMWMLSETSALKFGRGGFTMADGTVVSQNDWEAIPYSFDGILYTNDMDMMRLSLFMVKAGEGLTVTNGEGDPELNFYGVSLDWKNLPEVLKMAHLHVMQINGDSNTDGVPTQTGGLGTSIMRYGLSVGGDTAGVDYAFTYAANQGDVKLAGTKIDSNGSMMQATVGYTMAEVMNSRIYFKYHTDTGDDSSTATENEGYDSFFYEKHGSSGLMDVVAWGNLTSMSVGYTFAPMDSCTAGIHYHMFERTEDSSAFTSGTNNGAAAIPASGAGSNDKKDIGSEIDLELGHKYDGGLSVYASIGMFSPGAHIKDAGGEETYTQAFLQAKMGF